MAAPASAQCRGQVASAGRPAPDRRRRSVSSGATAWPERSRMPSRNRPSAARQRRAAAGAGSAGGPMRDLGDACGRQALARQRVHDALALEGGVGVGGEVLQAAAAATPEMTAWRLGARHRHEARQRLPPGRPCRRAAPASARRAGRRARTAGGRPPWRCRRRRPRAPAMTTSSSVALTGPPAPARPAGGARRSLPRPRARTGPAARGRAGPGRARRRWPG